MAEFTDSESTSREKNRIRRSKRCNNTKMEILLDRDENTKLALKFIDTFIGHGVFATKPIEKGEYLLEYKGRLVDQECDPNLVIDTGFHYFFIHKNRTMCIDATDSQSLGRMVNDERAAHANCKIRKVVINETPRLCIFALKDISQGEELRYDYGGHDLPWRKLKKGANKPVLYSNSNIEAPSDSTTDHGHRLESCLSADDIQQEEEEANIKEATPDLMSICGGNQSPSDSTTDHGHRVESCLSADDIQQEDEEANIKEATPDLMSICGGNQSPSDSTTDHGHRVESCLSADDIQQEDEEANIKEATPDLMSICGGNQSPSDSTTDHGHRVESCLSADDIQQEDEEANIKEATPDLMSICGGNQSPSDSTTDHGHRVESCLSADDIQQEDEEANIKEATPDLMSICGGNQSPSDSTTDHGHRVESCLSADDIQLEDEEANIKEATPDLMSICGGNQSPSDSTTDHGHRVESCLSADDIQQEDEEANIKEATPDLMSICGGNQSLSDSTTDHGHRVESCLSADDIQQEDEEANIKEATPDLMSICGGNTSPSDSTTDHGQRVESCLSADDIQQEDEEANIKEATPDLMSICGGNQSPSDSTTDHGHRVESCLSADDIQQEDEEANIKEATPDLMSICGGNQSPSDSTTDHGHRVESCLSADDKQQEDEEANIKEATPDLMSICGGNQSPSDSTTDHGHRVESCLSADDIQQEDEEANIKEATPDLMSICGGNQSPSDSTTDHGHRVESCLSADDIQQEDEEANIKEATPDLMSICGGNQSPSDSTTDHGHRVESCLSADDIQQEDEEANIKEATPDLMSICGGNQSLSDSTTDHGHRVESCLSADDIQQEDEEANIKEATPDLMSICGGNTSPSDSTTDHGQRVESCLSADDIQQEDEEANIKEATPDLMSICGGNQSPSDSTTDHGHRVESCLSADDIQQEDEEANIKEATPDLMSICGGNQSPSDSTTDHGHRVESCLLADDKQQEDEEANIKEATPDLMSICGGNQSPSDSTTDHGHRVESCLSADDIQQEDEEANIKEATPDLMSICGGNQSPSDSTTDHGHRVESCLSADDIQQEDEEANMKEATPDLMSVPPSEILIAVPLALKDCGGYQPPSGSTDDHGHRVVPCLSADDIQQEDEDSDRESLLSEMEVEEDSVVDPDFELSNAEKVDSESSLSTQVMDSDSTIVSDSDEIPVQPNLTCFLKGHQSESNQGESNTISFGLFPKGQKKKNCKQIYDKVNFCTFCTKEIKSKISRHILSVHKMEQRVSDIIHMSKKSESRRVALEVLSNEGNFKHNIEVLKTKVGYLVVGRRETKTRNVKHGDYLPCQFCKKFIMKETLWLHHRNCTVNRFYMKEKKNEDGARLKGNNAIRQARNLLNSALLENSDHLVAKMLTRMHDDEITDVVRNDMLIRKYAALRVESLGHDTDQKLNDMHRVSQCSRTLARLVICCKKKKLYSLINLDKLISPEHFDLVIAATKSMCIDKENVTASLGRFMGNILAHVIQTKKGDALRNNDNRRLEQAEKFQRLYDSEWNYRVNSVCQKRINSLNRLKVKTVPLTSDLQKLRNYIMSSMKSLSDILKKSKLPDDWTSLAKLTICRLILFNKGRRAEVKDLKLKDYLERPNWKVEQQGEFEMALSTSDKLLAERMDMIISAGKSRKNVDAYVLLPPDAKGAIDLLNSLREKVGIPVDNPYIFARMNSASPLSGNTDLREVVDRCADLQYPERISSTSLRKYIATVSQILDMTDQELEMLANHLGHDTKTHKENYRLSHSTRELTVVSQLLIAVDNGCVNKWRGQQLANISIDELPDVEQFCEEKESECAAARTNDGEDADCFDSDFPTYPTVADDDDADDNSDSSQAAQAGEVSHQEACVNNAEIPRKKTLHRKKTPWSSTEEDYLRTAFKFYLNGTRCSVHKDDLLKAQKRCDGIGLRTLAQIRSKLNNMKLGKSK